MALSADLVAGYEALEGEITRWADGQALIRAVAVVGSRARDNHPADAWSDLDLIFFVQEPHPLVKDSEWLSLFGETWLKVLNTTGGGDPEWLVLYAGGFKVDFLLAPVTNSLENMLFHDRFAEVCRRGVRVLLAKDDELGFFLEVSQEINWLKPNPQDFVAAIQRFWLTAYRASMMLRRGEIWRARSLLEGTLRTDLLQMVEWQAKARWGENYDTWHDGRFIAEWAVPETVGELFDTFGSYGEEETTRALAVSMRLFDRLLRETAEIWRYPYPAPTLKQVSGWIENLLSEP